MSSPLSTYEKRPVDFILYFLIAASFLVMIVLLHDSISNDPLVGESSMHLGCILESVSHKRVHSNCFIELSSGDVMSVLISSY